MTFLKFSAPRGDAAREPRGLPVPHGQIAMGHQQAHQCRLLRLALPQPSPLSFGGHKAPKTATVWGMNTKLVWCEVCYSPQNGSSRGGRFGIHPAVSIAAIVGF